MPTNKILDDLSSFEEVIIEPKDKRAAFLRQLFTGTGMFYVDNRNGFKWFYLIVFIYGLIGCLNMLFWENFRIGFPVLGDSYTEIELGAFSILMAVFISYPIAFLHLNWLINQQGYSEPLVKSKKVAFLWQLFTGTGMFYVDSKNRFRWFYFVLFAYALIGSFNMICWANFRIGFTFLVHFHNKVALGALSLLTSVFIAYPIALLHLNWLINKQKARY